ncbi:MAG: IS630 family transposase [Parachlamydia sp.]|nr:IS630 family transposase [Parachlamydia sp.]
MLSCTGEVLKELQRIGRSHSEPKRRVDRVRIILACLENDNQTKVAEQTGTRLNTVGKWRSRFILHGIAGLDDAPRTGKPKTVGNHLRKNILRLLETPPPKGQATWDGVALSKALGVKKSSVYNTLSKDAIQLQRIRSWCVSTDPEFGAKSADVIGLYLNPPERAIVFCVDEKPSIQALSRKTGYVETSSGTIVRGLQSTYRRNGTLNLFAALNVATGNIISKTTSNKKRPDFQEFMDDIVRNIPITQEIHVVLDNYCTHKKNEDWLKAHPNVTFHFTPTSASWLNMVEIWLGILTRKALRGASFNSKQELKEAIEDFCKVYNTSAKPFVWKKREVKGSQLKNTIVNLIE